MPIKFPTLILEEWSISTFYSHKETLPLELIWSAEVQERRTPSFSEAFVGGEKWPRGVQMVWQGVYLCVRCSPYKDVSECEQKTNVIHKLGNRGELKEGTKWLGTTKHTPVPRANKAREILYPQAWRCKERERSLLSKGKEGSLCEEGIKRDIGDLPDTSTSLPSSSHFLPFYIMTGPNSIRSQKAKMPVIIIYLVPKA